jgi:predicted RND superfamily exporter protein
MPSLWSRTLRRSAWTICLTGILTLVCLFTIRNLQFDTSPSTLILAGSSEARYYEEIKRIFGNDQLILIGIQGDNLLRPSELGRVRDLTNELERIPGVKRVLSLTNVKDVRGAGDEVVVSPLVPEEDSPTALQELRGRIRNNPFYVKNLISSDERTLAVLVFLEEFGQKESLLQGREVTRQVRAITRRVLGEGQAFVSGLPEMELQGTENMIRDLRVLTPLTLVLVTLVLAVSFRCLRGIVLPLGMIALAVVWTLAAMVWSGRPLKVTTVILPSLLISNGTSYVIHFLAQYYRLLHKAYDEWGERTDTKLDRATYHQTLLDAVAYTHSPIFISAATTMAGFGAFIFSGIPAIRDLGIFATVGVFLSYWFCVLLVPSFLWFSSIPRLDQLPEEKKAAVILSWRGLHGSIFIEPAGSTLFRFCPPDGLCGGYSIFTYIPTIFPTSTRMHRWYKRPDFFMNGWPGLRRYSLLWSRRESEKLQSPTFSRLPRLCNEGFRRFQELMLHFHSWTR